MPFSFFYFKDFHLMERTSWLNKYAYFVNYSMKPKTIFCVNLGASCSIAVNSLTEESPGNIGQSATWKGGYKNRNVFVTESATENKVALQRKL